MVKCLISFLCVQIVVVGVAVVLLGFGVWGVVEIEQDYQQEWFIPKGNYFYDYLQIANEYFPDDGWDGYVYMGKYNQVYFYNSIFPYIPFKILLPKTKEANDVLTIPSFFSRYSFHNCFQK